MEAKSTPPTGLFLLWQCAECNHVCNLMKSENRCICGHRFKEHKQGPTGGPLKNGFCPCSVAKCSCANFFYMIAEGAWIIRCRCKHKHIEHLPNPPYQCTKCVTKPPQKAGSKISVTTCSGFDSPFVCNCNHGWASHHQVWEERQLSAVPALDEFGDPRIVKRGIDD